MPRDLSEVLHFFMPELAPETEPLASAPVQPLGRLDDAILPPSAPPSPRRTTTNILPIVAVPIGDSDVVRASFAWNLVVEVARLGGRGALVTPGIDDATPLWPEPGVGPLGAELIPALATDLGSLYRVAIDTAVDRAANARESGVVFVRVPPTWLCEPKDGAGLLKWTLLFTSAHADDLRETYGIGKLVLAAYEQADVGVTVHGARSLAEAENAFTRLADATRTHLQRDLLSYGLLVDDLHVYRAIVAQRPIGLAHPQSSAARAVHDVARMILGDARTRAVV